MTTTELTTTHARPLPGQLADGTVPMSAAIVDLTFLETQPHLTTYVVTATTHHLPLAA